MRFGVSLDKAIKRDKYSNRSEAIRDLIRKDLVKTEWKTRSIVAGVITVVYDHHRRELVNTLVGIQHKYQHLIISSQHIHLDHDNCLETIVVKGRGKDLDALSCELKSAKGVKYGSLSMATTGKHLV